MNGHRFFLSKIVFYNNKNIHFTKGSEKLIKSKLMQFITSFHKFNLLFGIESNTTLVYIVK